MSDVDTTDTVDTEEPDGLDTAGQDTDTDEPEEWTPPDKAAWDKIQAKAEKRDRLLREAQAKIAELTKKDDAPAEPTETDKLRQGMVRTAGRAVLAGIGVTDRKDQTTILEAIRLDGIDVDDDGEVDTDALEERVAELRRILAPAEPTTRRVPRVETRDRGGKDTKPADPDTARYRRIMSGR